MTYFLTDGRHFLGPYHPDEVAARKRGERWLREVEKATEVYVIQAQTEPLARLRYRKIRK